MQSLHSLLVSARNAILARRDTSPLPAFHHDEHALPPVADARPARHHRHRLSLSSCASLLLVPAFVAAASMPLRAQDLIVIDGEYNAGATVQRLDTKAIDNSPVLSSVLLASIPPTQRIRGITPIDGDTISATEFIVYAEHVDGTSHLWKVDFVAGITAIRISPLLWDEESATTRPEDMVGIARTRLGMPGLGLLAPAAWHASIGQSGALYAPLLGGTDSGLPGATSNGGSGSLPFPGPYVGAGAHNNHLFVMTGGSFVLRKVTAPGGQQSLLGSPTPLVELQSWTIPVTGQVLGWTLSEGGIFYAIVNRVSVANGLASGYTELVRSTQSVDTAVATLTLVSVGGHIQDWNNGDGGAVSFPPVYLAFAKD